MAPAAGPGCLTVLERSLCLLLKNQGRGNPGWQMLCQTCQRLHLLELRLQLGYLVPAAAELQRQVQVAAGLVSPA